MNEAFLCLGGNMGDRLANLNLTKALMEEERLKITAQSHIYETKAWGSETSPDYYNQCVKISTEIGSQQLMKLLLDIEKRLGRVRNGDKNQPRTADIDILFFNNEIINTELLVVPHPRLHLRQFVLKPLHEIAREFMHPLLKKTVSQLLQECTDTLSAQKIEQHVYLH